MIKYFYTLILLFACILSAGAQVPATGFGKINTSKWITKNIKTDFGAKGNGSTNDQAAFKKANNFIVANKGNVILIIPAGTYIVGNQTRRVVQDNVAPLINGEPVLSFTGISNVIIKGTARTKVKYASGLSIGSFEPATGAAPQNLNKYNPSSANSENKSASLKTFATAGNFLELMNCKNFMLTDLELDGNSDGYKMGGNWGLGGNPFELTQCYGIYLYNIQNCSFQNLKIHDFIVDNISLGGTLVDGDTSKPLTNNIVFNHVQCTYAGRNNFSWLGGNNIYVANSVFNYAGTKKIKTAPGAGMDIEPEGLTGKVACTNGYFYNNIYKNNTGLGMTPGTSLDNPVYASGYGYSFNHTFRKCTFIGKTNAAVYIFINRVTFDSCGFYGYVLNYGSTIKDEMAPVVFSNSVFSDCYNGQRMYDQPLLSIEFGYRMQLINCVFNKYYSSNANDWVFFYGTSTYQCNDESFMPLFKNNTFNFYAPADSTIKYICVARKIKFSNNKFYKPESNNIRWYISTGCKPGVGEGNIDVGNGLQYFNLPKKFVAPKCKTDK
ncbi:MAG: hypothetical protein JSU03_10495 [Bacteroidetes bacterium]|nr:hypothetical protein [Bacteroidota bacterium]MBS1757698.1 hypothetical protein [Bacteroidota bacterium]